MTYHSMQHFNTRMKTNHSNMHRDTVSNMNGKYITLMTMRKGRSKENLRKGKGTSTLRLAMLAVVTMIAAVGARAQTYYVFYNDIYGYIVDNLGTPDVNTTFSEYAVWRAAAALSTSGTNIRSYTNDSHYLRGDARNYLTIGNSQNNWQLRNNELTYRAGGTNYYVVYANGYGLLTYNTSNYEHFTIYQVTISSTAATLTGVTISGDETLTATGGYAYTLSGTYTSATTNYSYNNADHYSPAQTTETVTPTGTWSVSGTGASYVTVSTSTGTITVNSVPTDGDKTITLSCKPSHADATGTEVTKTITLKAACAAPTFSFDNATNQVTLSTTTAGATIYYTTNGSTPTTSSTQYTGAFEQSEAAMIKAIAVKDGVADSEVGTYQVQKLATPLAVNNAAGNAVTFTSTDEDVTFYYTYGNYDSGGEFAAPTTSSTSWHTGDAAVTIPTENVVKVIAAKAATATKGYITSDVYMRRVNATDMSERQIVIMYNAGTAASPEVHFLANVNGTVQDVTTFNPTTCIWEALPYASTDPNIMYEPCIHFRNNGRYLTLHVDAVDHTITQGWDDWMQLLTTVPNYDTYYVQQYLSAERGTIIMASMIDATQAVVPTWASFQLGYDVGNGRWGRYTFSQGLALYDRVNFAVYYPVEELGGGNYLLNVDYPAYYETTKEEVNKGESVTITSSITGPDGTGTGTYGLPYYRVGNEADGYHYYYSDGGSTPLTSEPTPSTDIRITYELLNGQSYLDVDESTHTYTLTRDPGRDLYVTVRVTATPYVDGVAQPDGIQTKDYQFNILTSPPFPAPVISRVEGTNNYQMECPAANAIIEYQINDDGTSATCTECGDTPSPYHDGWCLYDGPITVTTAGTVISARSFRQSDNMLSDPVDYHVGGARLLPPVITIDNNGNVTITANPDNLAIDGYTGGETFYYTIDGSEPDATSTPFSGSFTISNGQTVKAIATATGFTSSAIALNKYQVTSGTSSYGVVTLNDYEDHDWSYYQPSSELPTGYPDQLHSPYPRNVQITYFGYGENTLSTSATTNPAANTFNTDTYAGDVKVGIGEEGHTFVYYKTLERDANNRFPYELIPNPFSVRPDVRNYSGSKTVTFTLNDAGGDGWGASHLQVDFSNGRSTENITFTESQASKTVTLSVNTGVTMTLTWVAGGGTSDECSFTVSYDGNTVFSSGLNPQNGPIGAVKVNGSDAVTTYTGFYRWRIKSITDGAVYSASAGGTPLAVGTMLEAETTYYFQPSDNSQTNAHNATSMKIELEALWAPAEVTTGTSFSRGYNSVERNFSVGRSGTGNNVFGSSTPCTYSSFYPNGTTNGTTQATLANRLSIGLGAASAASKVEYYNISGTLNAAGRSVTMGRGISSSGVAVYGLNSNNTAMNQVLRIETGGYSTFRSYNVAPRSVTKHWVVFGSDYDRASGDNTQLTFTGQFLTAQGLNLGLAATGEMARVWSKSGSFMTGISVANAAADNSYYIGVTNTHNNGHRYLEIEGGEWYANIAGGMGENHTSTDPAFTFRMRGGIIRGSVYGAAAFANAGGTRTYILTGGSIGGWVAGGANGTQSDGGAMYGASFIYVGGNASVDSKYQSGPSGTTSSNSVINRAVGGNVFGAGCGYGASSSSGQVTLGTNVAIADNAYVERGVYGGGSYGYTTATSNIYILGGTVNGSMGGVSGTTYSATINGGVFGGACQNRGGTVNIYMTGGQVNGGVYGGSNSSGNISGNVTMHIDGGQVGEDADHPANIHGGGLGNSTRVLGSVNLTLGTGDVAVDTVRHVTVYGDVYGGSAQGRTNGNTSLTAGAVTNVTMNAGKIYGSLYGGGLGNSSYAADVYGPVQVTVNGGGIHATINDGSGAVYGCNNANGAPQSTVNVDIYGTDAPADGRSYALDGVYGGGNASAYAGTPVVKIHNCENSIEEVYGGGNAAAVGGTDVTIFGADSIGTVYGGGHGDRYATPELIAPVNGDVVVRIYGGKIGKVYGASNSRGPVSGSIKVYVQKQTEEGHSSCVLKVGELYSGGNLAASAAGTLYIGCTGDYIAPTEGYRIGYELEGIGEVYGGANSANITGDITLNINGGIINRIFGGNNNSGNIDGKITININNTEESCDWYVGDVLGGGNQAVYTAPAGSENHPVLNLTRGTISGNVYGGGYGDAADATKGVVNGNPDINLTGCDLLGDLYGGGQMADVDGSIAIDVTGGSVAGAIYGGGALADTNIGNTVSTSDQTTIINLVSGTVHDVYGGGLGDSETAALVGGDVTITLNGSAVTGTIFGCNNVNGTPLGHVKVLVEKTVGWTGHDVSAGKTDDTIAKGTGVYEVAAVYGGGNLAAYEPTSSSDYTEVIINGCDLTSIQYVYGGGNAASVPATEVTVNGTYEIEYLFGGGNGKDNLPNGDPNPGANVGYKADGTTIYGKGETSVNAFGGTIHHVFGGSNTLGNVRKSSVAFLDEVDQTCLLDIDEVYGGGNEAYMEGDSKVKLGCITAMRELYGGAKNADIGGDIELTITSGHFGRVFGGNNLGGSINGFIRVNIEETGCHPLTIGELYGCGNAAAYTTPAGKADPTINIRSFTSIGTVFGGGLGATADVTGNPTVNINEVVGVNASETSTYAGTTITLPDNSTVALPAHTLGKIGVIGTVYGGGNAAKVKGNTNVNIGTKSEVIFNSPETATEADRTKAVIGVNIQGNVFGGGLGATAIVTGNTNVVVGK